ncbi:MAG TPA: fructosamine kinase family protein [Gammaproteobacteria bacterium]|nr:fructosamine kinase family protein [Gammaproteobacteria bacterium]
MGRVDWLIDALRQSGNIRVCRGTLEPVGGGSINRAFKISADPGPLFVKVNDPDARAMFEAEALGLALLREAGGPRVPEVIAVGSAEGGAYIALEWLDLGAKTASAERDLGAGLARQHRRLAETFGWDRDNTIGTTPQINTQTPDWGRFFADQRLGFQIGLAERNGLSPGIIDSARELLDQVQTLLGAHAPSPSLLHGDLWGGNWGATRAGTAVIFDPAVYFGDRETDIAMTRLFGGFGPDFYSAYEAAWPLPAGWQRRAELYKLYHLLNHFNLFGASYAGAVRSSIGACLQRR